jgi:hypothetical protein
MQAELILYCTTGHGLWLTEGQRDALLVELARLLPSWVLGKAAQGTLLQNCLGGCVVPREEVVTGWLDTVRCRSQALEKLCALQKSETLC